MALLEDNFHYDTLSRSGAELVGRRFSVHVARTRRRQEISF